MPIRPCEQSRYPANWREISARIKARAGFRCESAPGLLPCRAREGERHPITHSVVVLTVAHLDHQPENCREENLRALCQRCHNRYDHRHRQRNAAWTRRANKANGELFPDLRRREEDGPYGG
jgi:hypothetical protein